MKLLSCLLVLGIVLLSAGLMSGQAIFTDFTGTSTGSKFLNFGTWSCPGGEPAGPFPPNPPCSPGSRVHFRDVVLQNSTATTDPRMTGTLQFVFNGNTDGWTQGPPVGPGTGPAWGTFHMDVTGGGVWEGTYTGFRQVTPSGVLTTLHFVGEGSSGNVDGLKVWFEVRAPHNAPSTIAGRILQPGRNK